MPVGIRDDPCFRALSAARDVWDDDIFISMASEDGSLPAYFRQIIAIASSPAFRRARFGAVRDTDKLFILRGGLKHLASWGQLSPDELALADEIERLDDETHPGFS